MRYVELPTTVTSNMDFCFAGKIVNSDTREIEISNGEAVAKVYPADPYTVEVHFHEDFAGVKMPSLIGNTSGLLMLHREVIAAFEAKLDLGPHEVLPFSLVNHKGRVHSKDYRFYNPLGTHDVASPRSQFLRYKKSGAVYDCEEWVLQASKLVGIPDLVRPKEVANTYFVSERLIALVSEQGFTNFEVEEVDIV
jgi:hypothetical protein